MKKKVIVKAPALSASGYGEHARFVLRSLRAREDLFDIYLHNITWGKTSWIFEDSEERQWMDQLIKKTAEYLQERQGKPAFDISLQVPFLMNLKRLLQRTSALQRVLKQIKFLHNGLRK